MFRKSLLALAIAGAITSPAFATIHLIAQGSIDGNATDLSGLSNTLENGVAANLLGGMGSGLAWAGGNTFLALPDRGPNATAWNANLSDTASYIARFQTVQLPIVSNGTGLAVAPKLVGTTLLYSDTPLSYGAAGVSPGGVAFGAGDATLGNSAAKFYFTGRSDNFDASKSSLNPNNARLDPEGIRLSADGKSVFISDEYGPYIYQFDRATGRRIDTFALPAAFGIANLNANGTTEISANTASGRITNKGMEGLAISPDGKTLVGFMQSPLAQDGGDGGRANRIVTIDIGTHAVKQFAYDNKIGNANFNSSEIVALNKNQFLVLERDGRGLGSDNDARVKQVYLVDLNGATDITGLSGEANLLAKAPTKSLFLDLTAALNSAGIANTKIPGKLEGLAFGQDVVVNNELLHTLYVANDNDFLATSPKGLANPNQWFVFGVSDADLRSLGASFTQQSVPAPNALALLVLALGSLFARRRKHDVRAA